MANLRVWNAAYESSPADGDNVSEGAERIRNLKTDIRERLAKDHFMDPAGTDADHGEHARVTFHAALAEDPATVAEKGFLYTKDVLNAEEELKAELFWKDEDGHALQITSGGEFDGDRMDIDYEPANYVPDDSPEEALDADDLAAHLKGIDTALAVAVLEHGCRLSVNAGDTEHDVDISAGLRVDGGHDTIMRLASPVTKRIDAPWAAGTNAGGLDAGSVDVNLWYHLYVIKNPETGAVDALFSTSASSPAMPEGFTKKCRVGAVMTNSSANLRGFAQVGDRFLWKDPVLDFDAAFGDTNAHLITVASPTGLNCEVKIRASHSVSTTLVYISSPLIDDEAPDYTAAPLANLHAGGSGMYEELDVITDEGARVRARANSTTTQLRLLTVGWRDPGGRMN